MIVRARCRQPVLMSAREAATVGGVPVEVRMSRIEIPATSWVVQNVRRSPCGLIGCVTPAFRARGQGAGRAGTSMHRP